MFGTRMASILDSLKTRMTDASLADDQRAAAARRWVGLEDQPTVVATVLRQITLLTPPALASGLIQALGESRDERTGKAVTEHWPQFTPTARRTALAVLLRRGEWALALLEAVDKQQVNRTDLAPEHWSQLKQHPNRAVARRAPPLVPIHGRGRRSDRSRQARGEGERQQQEAESGKAVHRMKWLPGGERVP